MSLIVSDGTWSSPQSVSVNAGAGAYINQLDVRDGPARIQASSVARPRNQCLNQRNLTLV